MLFDRWRVEQDLESIKKRLQEEFGTPVSELADDLDESLQSDESAAERFLSDGSVPDRSVSDESAADGFLSDKSALKGSADVISAEPSQKAVVKEETRVGAKDIIAMIIAVFSLLLPFIITMFVVMGLFLLFFFRNVIF